jgi:hypothetical protein
MIHKWATTTDLKHEKEQVQSEYQAMLLYYSFIW